jgi:triphosphatase
MRERKEEGLHQMRIGLRRLRAALSLFAPLLAGDRAKHIKGELKWMTQQLGPARDLDVLIKHLLQASGKDAPQQQAVDRLGRLKARREQAYADAAAMTRSPRFCLALLDIAEWIETEEEHPDQPSEPIAEYAAGVLAKRRKRVGKKGVRLDELAVKGRHKLRIRAKNLRYGIEFFASLFPGKVNEARRSAALSSLKQLQDLLGELNDIAIRDTLLGDAAKAGQSGDAVAEFDGDGVEGSDEHHAKKLLAEAKRAHAEFAAVKSSWKARGD